MDSSIVELRQLFRACDRQNRGYIDRTEFKELCTSFDIENGDADVIFTDLDRDGDQRINLEDFTLGFREFLTIAAQSPPPPLPPPLQSKRAQRLLRKQATERAWKVFSDRLGQDNIRRCLNNRLVNLSSCHRS